MLSDIMSVTPSLPTRSNCSRSKFSPSTGFSSIFQSPVCTTVPAAHRKIKPQQSGMECVTLTASISKGPASNLSPMSITLNLLPSPHRLNSFIRRCMSCMVKRPAYTGVVGSSAGMTHGNAPMWSSCPCVMSTASTLSLHRARNETSGSTFWMPSSSWSGNMRPASSSTYRFSVPTSAQFMPISPRPPRGRNFIGASSTRPPGDGSMGEVSASGYAGDVEGWSGKGLLSW